MLRRDATYLYDILDAAEAASAYVVGMDEAGFTADRKTQSAVIREILIIGEATKQVSAEFRAAHLEIPWRAMAGMRDVLVHNYRGTDLENLWDAVSDSIPQLITRIGPLYQSIMIELEGDSGPDSSRGATA